MKGKAFDSELYQRLQSQKIMTRVQRFDNKLYLEFGGKLFDDFHASRVLRGFSPDSKLKMLLSIKDLVEILVVISAEDIESNKIRRDIGSNYQNEVLRLIDAFHEANLLSNKVVISKYVSSPAVDQFIKKLNNLGIETYKHFKIDDYPQDIDLILSEEGFGKNEFVPTIKPLVVVTAPGPGSGKMAVALSQLYHENKHGIKAGYAKYETFPVWNLPLSHPLNLAYEAATADLNDVNMIDPFHLDEYNILAINYNRDVEVFPVVKKILEKIYGTSPYLSPTDMGVNMVREGIINEEEVIKDAKEEIIRRYLNSLCDLRNGKIEKNCVEKIAIIMKKLNIEVLDRRVVGACLLESSKRLCPCGAIELEDGTIITSKTSNLLGCAASLILNSIKYLAHIDRDIDLISRNVIEPIMDLKVNHLGNHNPRLHTDEVLLALAISATTNTVAELALKKLDKLKGLEAHMSVILSEVDESVYKKLGINLTTEAEYKTKKLYRK